jgi:linoleoyl-CoA desaturase
MVTPKFVSKGTPFNIELKRRINDYFDQNNIKPTGNFSLYFKAVFLTIGFLALYAHLLFVESGTWIKLAECVVLGGFTAAIGFNVMHDGAHGSFSSKQWVNQLAGLSLNFLGANVYMWKNKHNVVHHTFTNISGVDDDIDAGSFLRLCESQKRYKIHRFQHIYFWFVYSILYIYWVFFTDYKKYFLQKVGDIPIKKMTTKDHISFWSYKVLHAALFVALPIYIFGFGAWVLGFLVYGMFTGLLISIVFQLAHTVEETEFPIPTDANKIEEEWAIHQIRTTANFATSNKFISWCVGGLNFQIEHHLFPKISHVHYPAISKIIKKACEDYGINYIEFKRTRQAIASHISHLRAMGSANTNLA